jgi:hypothetical protein
VDLASFGIDASRLQKLVTDSSLGFQNPVK